jgi:sporulation protein YlmC with PRC-barrel domain
MAHYGMLGEYRFSEGAQDIRGSKLYGLNDEKLGKIDDVIFDHSTGQIRYVVVDTGGWLSSKKFIVSVDRLRASSEHEEDFAVDLNKQQIEGFPAYQEGDLESEKTWTDYEGRYRSKWETGPVMHREGTDRNITPTTQQMPGNSPSERAADVTAGRPVRSQGAGYESTASTGSVSERIIPAGTDSVVISNSAVGIGGRWDTFQSQLRERRKEAVTGCKTCTVGSATSRGADSVDTLRKAV